MIERGVQEPRFTTMVRLAEGLGMSVAELFHTVEGHRLGADDARPAETLAPPPRPESARRQPQRFTRTVDEWPIGSDRSSSASTRPRR
jgi:hypothetical protein